MPEWFLPLLLVLAFITVVGHLIWITLAWFVRKLFGLSRPEGRDQRQQCPYCRRWTPRHREWCDWCFWGSAEADCVFA